MPEDQLDLKGNSTSLVRALDDAIRAYKNYQIGVEKIISANVEYNNATKKLQGTVTGLVSKNRELTTSFERIGNSYKVTGQQFSQVAANQVEATKRIKNAQTEAEREATRAHNLRMQQLRAQIAASKALGQGQKTKGENTAVVREKLALLKQELALETAKEQKNKQNAATRTANAKKEQAEQERLLLIAQKQEKANERKHQKAMQASRERIAATDREALNERKLLEIEQRRLNNISKEAAARAIANQKRDVANQRAVIDNQKLALQQQRLNQAILNGSKSVQEMTISFQGLMRILLITTAYRAFFGFVNALKTGVTDAMDFQRAVAGVQTISQKGALSADEWADGLQRVSDGWRLDILEQTEAAYQTLTNQIGQGAEVFGFLEEANRFATAAFIDTNEAVRIGAAAINAMGIEVSEVSSVFSSFFKTIELGRLRGGELTEIGRILLPAKQLGIELSEVQAAMSTLTIQGVKANEAMTFLRGIFQKLIRPTEAMKDVFAELGVTTGDAAIEMLGFEGFLKFLEQRFAGSSDELGELFNRVRALAGIFGLSGSALEKFDENLKEIQNSTESYNKAVDLVQGTSAEKLAIQMSRLTNIFIRAGSSFLDTASDMTNGFSFIEGAARNLVTLLKGLVVPALAAVTAGFYVLGRAMLASPFGLAIAAISALSTAIAFLATSQERSDEAIRASLAETTREYEKANRDRLDAEIKAREESRRTLKESFQEVRQNIAQTVALSNSVFDLQTRVLDNTLDSVRDLGSAIDDTIKNNIRLTEQAIKDMVDISKSAIEEIDSIRSTVDRTLFDWELEGRKGNDAIDFIQKRINDLMSQIDAMGSDGVFNFDLVTSMQGEVRALVQQIKTIQDQTIQANKKVAEERAKLSKEYHENEQKLLRERNALQTKLAIEKDAGKRLDIQEDLADNAAELQKLQLDGITAASNLVTTTITERDLVLEITKLRDRQIAQMEKIAETAAANAKVEQERLAKQKAQQESFNILFKQVSDVRVKDILDLEDPELQAKALDSQAKAANKLIVLAQQLGVEYSDIESVLESVALTQESVLRAQRNKELQDLQKANDLEEKKLELILQQTEAKRADAEQTVEAFKQAAASAAQLLSASIADQGSTLFQNIANSLPKVYNPYTGNRLDTAKVTKELTELHNILTTLANSNATQLPTLLDGRYQELLTTLQSVNNLAGDVGQDALKPLLELLALRGGMSVPEQGTLPITNKAVDAAKELVLLERQLAEARATAAGATALFRTEDEQRVKDLLVEMTALQKIEADTAATQEERVLASQRLIQLSGELNILQNAFKESTGILKKETAETLSLDQQREESLKRLIELRKKEVELTRDRSSLSEEQRILRETLNRQQTNTEKSEPYSQIIRPSSSNSNKVTNAGTTINGDFNINVSSTGNNKIDAIGIGNALRAEIRRGTVKLA